jgi:hypothetical protein
MSTSPPGFSTWIDIPAHRRAAARVNFLPNFIARVAVKKLATVLTLLGTGFYQLATK